MVFVVVDGYYDELYGQANFESGQTVLLQGNPIAYENAEHDDAT